MKILIMTCSFSNTMGGIENFNRILIENLSNKYNFYELGLFENVVFSLNNKTNVMKTDTSSKKYIWLGEDGEIIELNKFSLYNFNNNFEYSNNKVEKKNKKLIHIFISILNKLISFFKLNKLIKPLINKILLIDKFFINLKKIKNNTKAFKNFLISKEIDFLICLTDTNKLFNINLSKIKKIKKIAIVHSDINCINNRKKIIIDKDRNIIKYVNKKLFFLLRKYKLSYFNKIIVSNPYELKLLRKNLFIKNKCEFINFSIFNKEQILNNLKNVNKKDKVIFVGRLSQEDKNIKELNKIAQLLGDNSIYVYGEGKNKLELTSKNIIVNGLTSKKELYEIYKESKILVLTSSTEGISYVLVEALCFGLVVVCYDTFKSCHWSLAENRGYLIKPYDSIAFVKALKEQLDTSEINFQNQSRKNILFSSENFSLEVSIKKWEKLFEKIFN